MLPRFSVVTCVAETDLARLKTALQDERFVVFEIDGRTVRDAKSFFDRAVQVLPLDPGLSGDVSWDALSDSLWGGLDTLSAPRVAVVWTSAHQMLNGALTDLLWAVDAVVGTARNLQSSDSGTAVPVDVVLFLVGAGCNFPPLGLDPTVVSPAAIWIT